MRGCLIIFSLIVFLFDTGRIESLVYAESKKEAAPQKRTRPKKKVKKKVEEKTEEEFENKVGEKSITHERFSSLEEEEAKLDAVLILDSSGSMKRTDPNRLRDQASKLFVRFLGQGDRVSILQFDQEVKRVSEFTEVTPENVGEIDRALQSVSSEGRFTDLELPLEEALKILQAEGRSGAKRIAVLLSDGKMDPHPSRGTADELTNKLFDSVLPEYRREHIPVFTVALSGEADQEYLGRISRATDALKFDAKDVQSVHKSFSDLYLSLKKPQVMGLEEGGFEIDPRVEEATFFISKTDPAQEVTLLSPTREKVTYLEFPPGTRWHRGEQFDVVTLRRPTPGVWRVEGIENPEGFATLVTDLKLQAQLSKTNLRVGDSAIIFARLTSEGKVFNKEALREITAFRYKVARQGTIINQGNLVDDGTGGDEKAGDGIYSATIRADEEGDVKLFVGVTSVTFSRQQQIPFEVSRGALSLVLKEADAFSGAKERFIATITKRGEKLKNPEVQLLAKNLETNKIIGIKLKPREKGSLDYEFETEKLQPGKYSVTARISGKDGKTGEIQRENSEAIEFERVSGQDAQAHAGATEDVETIEETGGEETSEGTSKQSSNWIFGLVGLIGSLVWSGGLVFFATKRLDVGKSLPAKEKPYHRPENLVEKLRILSEKRSERTRPPDKDDLAIFSLVAESLPDPESFENPEVSV